MSLSASAGEIVTVAETLEQARYAAALIQVSYEATLAKIDFVENVVNAYALPVINGNRPTDTKRGDAEKQWQLADAKIEATYETPIEHYHPLETHATIAVWEKEKLTIYDSTQTVGAVQTVVANTFAVPKENIRVLAPFVSGGFGSHSRNGEHTSTIEAFVELCGKVSRMMYDVPHQLVTHRVCRLNVQTPTIMRAPDEAPGSFALESAMDELFDIWC